VLLAGCANPSTNTTPVVQTNSSASPAAAGLASGTSGPVQFLQVRIDPTDAFVEILNTGGSNDPTTLDLGQWAIMAGAVRVTIPTNTRVAPGQSLRIHTGPAAGFAPSPLPVPSASAVPSRSPAASPQASPGPAGSPPVDLYLQPDEGQTFRQALTPGAELVLVDEKNTQRSQYTITR
jgi:hypothetical protein